MAKISSDKLIIRCYGEKKGNKWIGVCLDFNLATEANSSDELVRKMSEIIKSYIETVLATKDKGSIPALLSRKAPLRDWFKYYFGALSLLTQHLLVCLARFIPVQRLSRPAI